MRTDKKTLLGWLNDQLANTDNPVEIDIIMNLVELVEEK